MRWPLFVILAYICVLAQTVLGSLVTIRWEFAGEVMPDLLAVLAVFIALNVRSSSDVVISCWALGLAIDLTVSGGPGAITAIGPMAIAYSAGGFLVYKVRDVFFRDKPSSQMILAIAFCLLSHGLWVIMQSILGVRETTFGMFARMLLQALMLSLYTAVFAAPVYAILNRYGRWIIASAGLRSGRER